jgi:hypothetical protein
VTSFTRIAAVCLAQESFRVSETIPFRMGRCFYIQVRRGKLDGSTQNRDGGFEILTLKRCKESPHEFTGGKSLQ